MINKILDRLYVGDAEYTPQDIERYKINYVINLCGKERNSDSIRIHIPDTGDQNLFHVRHIMTTLEHEMLVKKNRVLVNCRAGMSRSPFIIALYLESIGMSFDEAVEFITQRNPITNIAPELIHWHHGNWM